MAIAGRAETDTDKAIIISRLLQAWRKVPQLRLGQFIEDVFNRDIYYIEDDKFIAKLEEFAEKYGKELK